MTERVMMDRLHVRYGKTAMGARRYSVAENVADRPMYASRRADFIAMDCYAGHNLHGHEIKCSRSDWLTELRDPAKAEAFRPFMNYWWLVVADRSIVADGELPDGWGLLVASGPSVRVTIPATRNPEPQPMSRAMTACLLRATAKTAAMKGHSS